MFSFGGTTTSRLKLDHTTSRARRVPRTRRRCRRAEINLLLHAAPQKLPAFSEPHAMPLLPPLQFSHRR
ncbi:3-hydroxyphenylacetate 6-hydroxylase [Sesbania bispinosa]|nr:3-hydroxyphenylacetate 6-hydroxylase [Sesbania bispinosa]